MEEWKKNVTTKVDLNEWRKPRQSSIDIVDGWFEIRTGYLQNTNQTSRKRLHGSLSLLFTGCKLLFTGSKVVAVQPSSSCFLRFLQTLVAPFLDSGAAVTCSYLGRMQYMLRYPALDDPEINCEYYDWKCKMMVSCSFVRLYSYIHHVT
jgi:hypothetical protein